MELSEADLTFIKGPSVVNRKATQMELDFVEALKSGLLYNDSDDGKEEEEEEEEQGWDLKKIENWLKQSVNPNVPVYDYGEWKTPFIMAYMCASLELLEDKASRDLLELFISYGADVNFCPYGGRTIMNDVALYGSSEQVKYFLSKGVNVNGAYFDPFGGFEIWTPIENVHIEMDCDCDDDFKEVCNLIEQNGGKYIDELLPWFYDPAKAPAWDGRYAFTHAGQ